jgi:hypothetical protein
LGIRQFIREGGDGHDLGGDCCADLEERVAELEATTVRKGNKKVSVTLSGWVVKSVNFWDDGDLDGAIVGDKGYDLGSRFAITGSGQIAPGWSGGFNLTILATSDLFATSGTLAASNQLAETGGTFFDHQFNPLYSYIYIKSDTFGTLNWGHLSPASDNPAVLADISGTVIESNGVWFEGASFFLQPKGNGGFAADVFGNATTWSDFVQCNGIGLGIGLDCWGAAMPAVRYDSPTWGGFRFQTSWGKNTLTAPNVSFDPVIGIEGPGGAIPGPGTTGADVATVFANPSGFVGSTRDANFWDIAAYYTADWNSIKVSAAYAFTWIESGANTGDEVNLHQFGASIMHKPSGLGIFGQFQLEDAQGRVSAALAPFIFTGPVGADINAGFPQDLDAINGSLFGAGDPFVTRSNQETDAWYIKPFWRKAWSPIGATVLYGEFGQYNDQFAAGRNYCFGGFAAGSAIGNFCNANIIQSNDDESEGTFFQSGGVFADSSEVERFGLGVVQEIDSAAMHLWARWQHQEMDATFTGFSIVGTNNEVSECVIVDGGCTVRSQKIKQSFDDWDLFQVGGIIFF